MLFDHFRNHNIPVVEISTLTKEGLIPLRDMVRLLISILQNVALGLRQPIGATC
jgi:hypothetical protein